MMLCPLLNTTVNICFKSLSALFTVSEGVISDVRQVLDAICADPNLESPDIIEQKTERYTYAALHPINRYPSAVREHVENIS